MIESTGHSRHLRDVLRHARERLGLTQKQVADAIAAHLDDGRSFTGSAVSEWERFQRHPAIDVMAAWARVVRLRLMVELDDGNGQRVPVLMSRRAAEVARSLDQLSDSDLDMIKSMVERMRPRS